MDNIEATIRELRQLEANGNYIFRGQCDARYLLNPKAFRPETIKQAQAAFAPDQKAGHAWFDSEEISAYPKKLLGRNPTQSELRTLFRLKNFCLFLMRHNYFLSIHAHENKKNLSPIDQRMLELRNKGYWKQEETFLQLYEAYLPTLIERSIGIDIIQSASPFEDLAALDETVPQHYGVATTILDWSFDANVAIYYALELNQQNPSHMKIFALKINNDFAQPPIKQIFTNKAVENCRAERQKGTFTSFTKPCSFFVEKGLFPTIDYYHAHASFVEDEQKRPFILKTFTIERTPANILYLEKILKKHGINEDYLFPDKQQAPYDSVAS